MRKTFRRRHWFRCGGGVEGSRYLRNGSLEDMVKDKTVLRLSQVSETFHLLGKYIIHNVWGKEART